VDGGLGAAFGAGRTDRRHSDTLHPEGANAKLPQ
jgi:hypothetical protein